MSSTTQAARTQHGGRRAGAIVLKKLSDDRQHHAHSARQKCFDAIEDGMTLEQYVAAARRKGVKKATAIGSLNKLLIAQDVAKRAARKTRH
jgi:hypothetical protein